MFTQLLPLARQRANRLNATPSRAPEARPQTPVTPSAQPAPAAPETPATSARPAENDNAILRTARWLIGC